MPSSFRPISCVLGVFLCCQIACDGDDDDNRVDAGQLPSGCVVDELFCNGIERTIDGVCVKLSENPCDDNVDCTVDGCNEETDTCVHTLSGECAECRSADCTPACDGKECGDDSCGGTCGECKDGEACAEATGQCAADDQLGTCAQPRTLEVELGQENRQLIVGDSTSGLHQVVPSCNSTSTAVEDVYQFTITEPTGIDARTHGYDTVLHIRREDPNTKGNDCLDDTPATTVGCSDDSAPPGDFGSRVAVLLQPGTYYLIVDGFDSTQFGAYTLDVTFVEDCVRQCDGKFCGDSDGCGGNCGECDEGFLCSEDLRCKADPCVPACTNEDGSPRACGDDGCGSTCGTCAADALCVLADGQCRAFPECDHMAPTCDPACGDGEYCGSDCTCKTIGAPAPDLVINARRLADEITYDTIQVDEASCAIAEACVGGTGERKLVRFSVEAVNQGQATLEVPPPAERPDLFEFSSCHGHFHFKGFATYELLDEDGVVRVTGRKQAYCMEDTDQVQSGPNVACDKAFTCDEQGIQAGWSDLYGNQLDCQWLDVTDLEPGDYTLRVSLNPDRSFEELSFDNNTASAEVPIE